jgi:hypothetical protein
MDNVVLSDRVERFVEPEAVAQDQPLSVGQLVEFSPETKALMSDQPLPLSDGTHSNVDEASGGPGPDLAPLHPGGDNGLAGGPLQEVVQEQPQPVPVFELEGRIGQFKYPHAALVGALPMIEAIYGAVVPLTVQPVDIPQQGRWYTVLAWSHLFRKLEGNERVPPYEFRFEDTAEGTIVYADEKPIPEENRIVVPNRKARREMGKHAQLHGPNGVAK